MLQSELLDLIIHISFFLSTLVSALLQLLLLLSDLLYHRLLLVLQGRHLALLASQVSGHALNLRDQFSALLIELVNLLL